MMCIVILWLCKSNSICHDSHLKLLSSKDAGKVGEENDKKKIVVMTFFSKVRKILMQIPTQYLSFFICTCCYEQNSLLALEKFD